jgi:hypothetical protein
VAVLHLVPQTQPTSLRAFGLLAPSHILRCLLRSWGAVLMMSPMCPSTSGRGGPRRVARLLHVAAQSFEIGALATTTFSLWRILCDSTATSFVRSVVR